MPYPDIWGVNKKTAFMDKETSVKDEFGAPCMAKYRTALNALKNLKQFHDIDAVFAELRNDVEM